MSKLPVFVNQQTPTAPAFTCSQHFIQTIASLAVRVGTAETKMEAAGKNAKAHYERCQELEIENAKLKKENDELLQSALTFAQCDDQGSDGVDK